MRIGVDASCWSNRRGFGRFTRELLTALLKISESHQYIFFADQQTASECRFPSNAQVVSVRTKVQAIEAASASGRRSLSDVWKMSDAVGKHRLEIFFFPAVYSYFPIRNRARLAVTVHDMTPARFPRSVFPNRKLQTFWNVKEWLAFKQADRIITVSNYSKDEIVHYRKISPSRVSIVTEGPGDAFKLIENIDTRVEVLSRFNLSPTDPYLLYVGGISPHKNLQRLISVFQNLRHDEAFSDYKLVLAGDFQKDSFFSDYTDLRKMIEELGLQHSIRFTGYVDDSTLAHLYNSAALFVFPSLQEGFGLPALEAMACGTPIAASKAGSLPEIIGDAGEMFDPMDTNSMLQAIRRVLLDEGFRQTLREKGLERAKLFTWNNAARQTLAIFDSMLQTTDKHR